MTYAPAYLIQVRPSNGSYEDPANPTTQKDSIHDQAKDPDPNGYWNVALRVEDNPGGPAFNQYAIGGNYWTTGSNFNCDNADRVCMEDTRDLLERNASYGIRVGTCKTSDCVLSDVAFASERILSVPDFP